ncbi:hypothetical protein MKW92_046058 [Papaver armeniacum]|nr:hypothetical protein MKW92_046058 [Papaver armeniacum]
MATTPTEMGKSYVYLIDLNGQEMLNDEIKVDMEGDTTLVISFGSTINSSTVVLNKKKFDLPLNVNLDAISAASHNGTLMVTIKKTINRLKTARSIKVTKA